MKRSYEWRFPLPRTHTGMLQGNGTIGAMIWGEANVLKITIGRADFWDHRGGKPWTEGMSYDNIRRLLEAGDEEGLRALFEEPALAPGEPRRPSVLPLGRIEVVLPPRFHLDRGQLDLGTGDVVVHALTQDGAECPIRITLSMDRPILHVGFAEAATPSQVRSVPSWEYVGDYLESISFAEPLMFENEALCGWVQERPADPSLCLGYRLEGTELWLTAVYGEDVQSARRAAANAISLAASCGVKSIHEANRSWWATYWQQVPHIDIPSERLSFLYHYGMYKFAGLTNPSGVPATLQGPWIEEYQMPPWSSDYHFNINVQMCYWPAYRGNLLHHLPPLFEMISSWEDKLRDNARIFLGIDDGLMLPHSVDDRGTCMGGFWTGSVDHGCTAWVAHMMYQYYLYTGDQRFLREVAYPFMVGAMRVYEEMLEREGERFVLPVGVSPEFRGAAIDAWGRNASFQLACIHWLCQALGEAASTLGREPKPIWQQIGAGLPRACLHGSAGEQEIALWEGLPLPESHRHHSHLAGIYPFDTLDLDDPHWRRTAENSLRTWIREGMGMWSGWAMPWASIIHTRVGNADMAELVLEIWEKVFTNEGHGTLHDCRFPGFTLMGAGATVARDTRGEIMQMDAGMGVAAAIMEMLLHTRQGVNHLFSGAPDSWEQVSFRNLRTEGGFLVSANRCNGVVGEIRVLSENGGTFRLANPWPGEGRVVTADGSRSVVQGSVLAIETNPGDEIQILQA